MHFEFDTEKSEANEEKHGIDFESAQALWFGSLLEVPARSEDEPRYAVIGKIDGIFWTAIITYRGDAIRIISVRKSREGERRMYEQGAKDKHN